MSARKPRRLTFAQCDAAIQMVEAALAGEEDQGDSTGLSFPLLRRTSDALRAMRGDPARSPEEEARDTLEAAAPALADALEDVLRELRHSVGWEPSAEYDKAEAALRAAGRLEEEAER